MSAFKREPPPQEETEKKKCVCPRRWACVSKCEREEKVELLKKGQGIDCCCRKMFLIYLGHRSRMGPSVSPHGRKTQSKKNNTLNLSSVQLQIGGRERERERGRQRQEGDREMKGKRRWRLGRGGGSQGEADAAMPVDKRKIHLSLRNKASPPSLLHSL